MGSPLHEPPRPPCTSPSLAVLRVSEQVAMENEENKLRFYQPCKDVFIPSGTPWFSESHFGILVCSGQSKTWMESTSCSVATMIFSVGLPHCCRSPQDSSCLPMCLVLALLIACKFFFQIPGSSAGCTKPVICHAAVLTGFFCVLWSKCKENFLPSQQFTCLDANLQNESIKTTSDLCSSGRAIWVQCNQTEVFLLILTACLLRNPL